MNPQKPEHNKYLTIGITAFCVIAASIFLFFCLFRFAEIKAIIGNIIKILKPIIYGLAFAYLTTPVYNWLRKLLREKVFKNSKSRHITGIANAISTFVTLTFFVAIVAGLIAMVLPQVFQSIVGILNSLPAQLNQTAVFLQKLLEDNPELEKQIMSYYNEISSDVTLWLARFIPNLQNLIAGISIGLFSAVMMVKDLLIGLIVTVYVLNCKENFVCQAKKIVYSILPSRQAQALIDEFRYAHRVFGGFINGKLIDSLIIGILCFIALSILQMPYTMLVSVIVGVTNIIPFFGPFIGAIPSFLLILLVNPGKSLIFLVFILLLQQFDGNILGPKILGDSTGLSSFWVLFSILLFGGLFGFVGMIVGVPIFAIFYHLTTNAVNRALRKKGLPEDTSEYEKK